MHSIIVNISSRFLVSQNIIKFILDEEFFGVYRSCLYFEDYVLFAKLSANSSITKSQPIIS